MGYNRRALYLYKTSQEIMKNHQGIFPSDYESLIKLPGVGTYTARAILVFAYRQYDCLVDTNIRKIITHYFFQDKPQKESMVESFARILVPEGKSWEWHQALMDFGALEMPKLFRSMKKRVGSKKAVPFRDSARFHRGKIVDLLRKSSLPEEEIIHLCKKEYGKQSSYVKRIMEGLLLDGLVEKNPSNTYRLPG
jgi:A/G-specific adenine glycosylase